MKITTQISTFFTLILILHFCHIIHSLGSGSTLSIISKNPTICGIISSKLTHYIQCYKDGTFISIQPNISYDSINGGGTYFCGLRNGGKSLLCWDTTSNNSSIFRPKRIYFSNLSPLKEISVGDNHVCGVINGTNEVICWRGFMGFDQNLKKFGGFQSISSGFNFTCGILMNNSRVKCWGSDETLANEIENQFGGFEMISLSAGGQHVCGNNKDGFLVCKGRNFAKQLDFPLGVNLSFGFSSLALGSDYSCAIRQVNGSVICWGGNGAYFNNLIQNVSFELLSGGFNFVCGLITSNFTIFCWGPGWFSNNNNSFVGMNVPLPKILPGQCVQSECSQCGIYPESQTLCFGYGNICKPCVVPLVGPSPPPAPVVPGVVPPTSKRLRGGLLVFVIVGLVGGFAGICSVIYCLYAGVCFGRKKIHNSVQPTITRGGSSNARTSSTSPPSRTLTIRRQGSLVFGRQRSGTSSVKYADRAEEFSFQELAMATDNFSIENKIGSGSFGVVYRGKLMDGREVAIKRGEIAPKTRKFLEKESAFESEIAFMSRVHHKHLVRLVGYCEEHDERLLVYDYMKNGALYDHLHDKDNLVKGYSVINAWKIRIKIALDAARGIEYLHNYAVPPIIHRDIKSANILLDSNWSARVSDFGLSLLGPEPEHDYKLIKAAGTIGYIDPEYYGLNVLTAKSDVYGLGVVLLELLTGKKAIFKDDNGGELMSVVDFSVPVIQAGELMSILDSRVGVPESSESEAVELVAYTALMCVNLEGKDRPTMTDIVTNLERALSLCGDSRGKDSHDKDSHDSSNSSDLVVLSIGSD